MKRILSSLSSKYNKIPPIDKTNYRPQSSSSEDKTNQNEEAKTFGKLKLTLPKDIHLKSIPSGKRSQVGTIVTSSQVLDGENKQDEILTTKMKGFDLQEYRNKFSLEKINFQFDEYGLYPDPNFLPSIFFFKFLTIKPDLEREMIQQGKKMPPKLKLFVPDTIILNDVDTNFWVYTDVNGYVCRTEKFSDSDVIEKLRSIEKDENELIAVCKIPMYKNRRLEENKLDLLNIDEMEKYLFSKSVNQFAIQKFIKCRGPKAFVCRSVWRRKKTPYVYILTNKANYHDNIPDQNLKYVVNSKITSSYFPFYATSGKHLEETNSYMNNIVKFVEAHTDIKLKELVGDFVKDEAGIWWFINIKALRVKKISKYLNNSGENINWPCLEYFLNRGNDGTNFRTAVTRKFDYQTKIKCKFCGIDYSSVKLKYKLSTKMILETDKMLRHVDFDKVKANFVERPDLKHFDPSMIYLPYRVCEDCYLLFETLNDIKNYQIEIGQYFKNPVTSINFGIDYYLKEKDPGKGVHLPDEEVSKLNMISIETVSSYNETQLKSWSPLISDKKYKLEEKKIKTPYEDNAQDSENGFTVVENLGNQAPTNLHRSGQPKPNNLYRILIMFTDLLWEEAVKIPEKDLYLIYDFMGAKYKVKIKSYYPQLDYCSINFMKIYHIICTEPEGFIEYVEKNRHMVITLGYFDANEEDTKKNDVKKLLNKEINIEDQDVYQPNSGLGEFIQFASVELSLQGLKYGENYRNNLNGHLFKSNEPVYVGKLRCIIRIHKVKEVKDIKKLNLKNHFNILIPPPHFVVSEELPEYWLEIVERLKLRENVLNMLIKTMKKYSIAYDKRKHKEEVFQALEMLVSSKLSSSDEQNA